MNLRTARVVVGVALGVWGFPPGAIAQPSYRIVDVGSSVATCGHRKLNQSGQVILVVVTQESGGFSARTFRRDSTGTRTKVETGFSWTVGVAINDAGQIAGHAQDTGQTTSTPLRPFLWTPGAGSLDLLGPRPGAVATVCDLNSAGDVVGALDTSRGFIFTRGRLWDLQTDVAPIGGEAWSHIGTGLSINDAGQIFGIGTTIQGNSHAYIMTPTTRNLLREPGFEGYAPPALSLPGWVSDSIRQVPAKSEFNQPHTGGKNGACWATRNLDCGMYQEVPAPATGTYSLTLYASADRAGGLIGANVNGATVASMAVNPRGFRNYGAAYTMTFHAAVGNTIRVWMYSPATPGYVVIDDVSLTEVR